MVICFNYILDNFYESGVFKNVSSKTKSILYSLLKEAYSLLRSKKLEKNKQDEFIILYSDCFRIYQCINVINLQQLF